MENGTYTKETFSCEDCLPAKHFCKQKLPTNEEELVSLAYLANSGLLSHVVSAVTGHPLKHLFHSVILCINVKVENTESSLEQFMQD